MVFCGAIRTKGKMLFYLIWQNDFFWKTIGCTILNNLLLKTKPKTIGFKTTGWDFVSTGRIWIPDMSGIKVIHCLVLLFRLLAIWVIKVIYMVNFRWPFSKMVYINIPNNQIDTFGDLMTWKTEISRSPKILLFGFARYSDVRQSNPTCKFCSCLNYLILTLIN